MKLRIVSDLHLEVHRMAKAIWFPPVGGENEVLVLAGDISTSDLIFKPFKDIPEWAQLSEVSEMLDESWISIVSKSFSNIILVYGNHDFWGSTLDGTIERTRELCSKFENVHFLEQDSVILDGIKFIGATLWTDLNKADPITMWDWRQDMRDSSKIRIQSRGYKKVSAPELVAYHYQSVEYIFDEVAKGGPCVVVTHHSPSYQSNMREVDRYCHYYHSELGNRVADSDNINLWIHGHTHDNVDYVLGDTRIVANMYGYHQFEENPDFDPYFTVEV